MNREIKFRGKRLDNREWVEGTPVWSANGRCYMITGAEETEKMGMLHYMINGVEETEKMDVLCQIEYAEVDPVTVGQYTGMQDKNGREIYEEDIVKAPLLDPIFCVLIKDSFCNAEIIFNKGPFVVSYYKRDRNIYLSDLFDKITVVGNIHDNPELLKD